MSNIKKIDIYDIVKSRHQARKIFNEDSIQELAKSIESEGLIQPISVIDRGGFYELIAGERRWKAHELLGEATIPAIIATSQTEEASLAVQGYVENTQRENLHFIESADGALYLKNKFGYTQKQLAEKTGKSREYIANKLRVASLAQSIKSSILESELTEGHVKYLMSLGKESEQQQFCKKAIYNEWSVKKLGKEINDYLAMFGERKQKESVKKDPNITSLEQKLEEYLGSTVKITDKEGKGSINIEYLSLEILDGILKRIFN
ncbi:hypothetical protein A3715_20145 [Oleiphilus sp. HI0009]|nr:hypothetical protein A3715_20145 [Oleiphilus sp. HI0009]